MIGFIKDKSTAIFAKLRRSYKSATIWINSLCASFFLAVPDLVHVLPGLAAYVPESKTMRYSIVFINLLNIALRFKTSKALEHK